MKKGTARWIAILLSILHAVLAVTASREKSPTFDEPTHLTAGYSYWLRYDFRLDPENGNLPARWAALPLLLDRPSFVSPKAMAWQRVSAGLTSRQFFYESGNDSDRILLHARMMMSLFSAALCLLIFLCTTKLFGPVAGLVSETIAVFDPNLLAHGALVTSDTAAALFFTAAVWSAWELFGRVTFRSLGLTAVSVAGLFLTKMSAPIFVPILAILALVRIFSAEAICVQIARFNCAVTKYGQKVATVCAVLPIVAATTVIAIWSAFGFRYSALAEAGTAREVLDWRWDYFLSEKTPASRAVGFARSHHLLPEAWLYGLLYTQQTATSRPAFLDGEASDTGLASFFLRAFIYKTPLPVLGIIILTATAAVSCWKRGATTFSTFCHNLAVDIKRLTPVWSLVLIYGLFALTTKLHIGWRHLLPIYPALFIGCGAAACFLQGQGTRGWRALLVLLIAWQATESFVVRPDYLAYFNQIAGGPPNGYKHLVDSSLDWGQDLPSLNDWLEQHRQPGERLYLAYFGAADPAWYGINAASLPQAATDATSLRPGLYCISATILQHVYEPESGRWRESYEQEYRKAMAWQSGLRRVTNTPVNPQLERQRLQTWHRLEFARLCAWLRHQQPVAQIGYSIHVYNVDETMLAQALTGPSPE